MVWNGITFATPRSLLWEGSADAYECSAPLRLPPTHAGQEARFAAVWFGRRQFVRWVRQDKKALLEIVDARGQVLARHPLGDSFGADRGEGSLSEMWLDLKHRHGPTLAIRTSDQVRLLVFPRGFGAAPVSADFSDASSSISATTASFGRDKRGFLTVTESYSERGDEDGNGGASHDTNYIWSGRGFTEK